MSVAAASATVAAIAAGRARRGARRARILAALGALLVVMFATALMVGQSFTPPGEVLRVILGERVEGASFTVGVLRLPRAVQAIVSGAAFGLGGVAFQIMLRNPLASPDIIGINLGASAAAVFAIVVLQLDGPAVSLFAVGMGLAVALSIYALAFKGGVVGTRLILMGIGVSAMLQSVISYLLLKAPSWDWQEAVRWLTGSLNASAWTGVLPTLAALLVFGGLLVSRARDLEALRLGDDAAAALGVRVGVTRVVIMVAAVGLIAFATAATGPIAFAAFLAGPIAARLVGRDGSLLVPAALVGALMVLVADFLGQFALGVRYPVGVVTGALGAPYLLYLIVRAQRAGGSL
jgi:iron complex transport system permease protein